MSRKQNVCGEGNYDASRKYNDATKKFAASGRAEQAARNAAPRTSREAAEMRQAEKVGLLRSRDKAPPVKDPPVSRPAVDEPERDPRKPAQKKAGVPRGRDPDRW